MNLTNILIDLSERGLVPDFLIRIGVRNLCRKRLAQCQVQDCENNAELAENYLRTVDLSPLAVQTDKANVQHYEVPASFYEKILGKNLKYSCCHYENGVIDLSIAEERALELTCEHADLTNHQSILELGCGWGSLSLWMAARYPHSEITSISNSRSQREHILALAQKRNLTNLEVITEDVNVFNTEDTFDRVVSVEMFEHVRNHRKLFKKINDWLKTDGKLFTHVFCHRSTSYPFEIEGEDDWMSRHFFSGGTMPSDELFLRIRGPLELQRRWRWSGKHYAKTSDAWLGNLLRNRREVIELFEQELSPTEALRTFHRWKMFFLACSETFGFKEGQEWWVSHYLFQKS